MQSNFSSVIQVYKLLVFTSTYESSEFTISNFSMNDIFCE